MTGMDKGEYAGKEAGKTGLQQVNIKETIVWFPGCMLNEGSVLSGAVVMEQSEAGKTFGNSLPGCLCWKSL